MQEVQRAIKEGQSEALPGYEALEFEEKNKGTLTAGKLADLVILDRNPMKVDPKDIIRINVMETIKEGRTVFKRS